MENKALAKLVVATEAVFFLALIMAFVYMAYNHGFEPHEVKALDIKSTGVYTLLLSFSSFSFFMTEKSFRNGKNNSLKVWMLITIILGTIFLFGQGKEYLRLIKQQVTLNGSVFGTSFFTLTGFHGLHVFMGLVILSILFGMAVAGDFKKPSTVISAAGIYWHFVDIVWIIVFTIVYVLPNFINK